MEPIDYIIHQEERDLLTGAILRLPEAERMVTRMCAIEGFSPRDAAGCLAMKPSEVSRTLARAQRMLAARLA